MKNGTGEFDITLTFTLKRRNFSMLLWLGQLLSGAYMFAQVKGTATCSISTDSEALRAYQSKTKERRAKTLPCAANADKVRGSRSTIASQSQSACFWYILRLNCKHKVELSMRAALSYLSAHLPHELMRQGGVCGQLRPSCLAENRLQHTMTTDI